MKIKRYENYTMEELRVKSKRLKKVLEQIRKDIGEDKIAKFERLGFLKIKR